MTLRKKKPSPRVVLRQVVRLLNSLPDMVSAHVSLKWEPDRALPRLNPRAWEGPTIRMLEVAKTEVYVSHHKEGAMEVGCSEDDEDLSELAPGEDQPAALTPPRAVEGELPALPARPIPALPPRQVLALPPREGTQLTMFAEERS